MFFQLISNSFVAIAAIILISAPQYFYAVFFARFIAGTGHGLGYVVVVQHFGELSDEKIRGRMGASLHLYLLKGGIISGSAVINFFGVPGRMDPNRFLGLFSLFINALAIVMTLMFYHESIITLIQSGRDAHALKTLMLLRGETEETPETMESFNEFKMMVVEDKYADSGIFSDGNFQPLVSVLCLRVCFVLTFNYALKFIHIFMTHNSNSGIDYTFILNLVHTFTTVAVLFTVDKGRRKHFLVSGIGSGVVLIIFGFQRLSAYANYDLLIFLMFVLFEFFSAIGLGLTAHIYSTEAFPTAKKPASIAFTSIIEFCLQIFFILWVDNRFNPKIFDIVLLLSSGFVLKALTAYLYFNLPETKLISIRKAKQKFLE